MRWFRKKSAQESSGRPDGAAGRLRAIKAQLTTLPARHPAAAVVVGPGVAHANDQIPIICRTIDEAVAALETGRDPEGLTIAPSQVGRALEHLVADVTGPGFSGLMHTVLSPEGVGELEEAIRQIAGVATDLRAAEIAEKRAQLDAALSSPHVSASLIEHVGVEEALASWDAAVADARVRWTRFEDWDDLSDREREERGKYCHRKEAEPGYIVTVEGRALLMQEFMAQRVLTEAEFEQLLHELNASAPDAPDERLRFIQRFVAEKVAGAAASDVMRKASLPEDRDIYLDLGASVYRAVIPMRVGEIPQQGPLRRHQA
jgi:hypothetical protein